MNVLENPMITLDCDWAPDFVLEYVADILTKNKVKATWFITNKSPFLSELESMKNGVFRHFCNKYIDRKTLKLD